MSNNSNNLYEFDEYVLNAKERNLWCGKELVQMPAKAFDTLLFLVERHGEVVSKEEMLERVWEGTFVEENNLSQKISLLRKTFGSEKEFIQTIPKVGFRFVAPVKRSAIEVVNGFQKNGDGSNHLAGENSPKAGHLAAVTEQGLNKNQNGNAGASSKRVLYPIAAVLSILIVGAFAFSVFISKENQVSKIPSTSFEYVELTDTGDIGTSTISPDGNFIAFTKTSRDRTFDTTTLRLMDVASKNDVEVPINGNESPGMLRFSPDGKSIYFRTSGNRAQFERIYRISILGGEPKLIAGNIWGSFSISPDGKKLLYFKRETEGAIQEIVVRDIESGKEDSVSDRLDRIESSARGAPMFSPDQKLISYIAPKKNSENGRIAVVDLETKRVKTIKTDLYSISEMVWHPDGKSLYIKALRLGKSFQIWNISVPNGVVTRVTSDSDSYKDLSISDYGDISVSRVNMNSNIWLVPDARIQNARQLTRGENGLSGLLTALFLPNGEILFNTRDRDGAGIRVFNTATNTQKPLTEKQIRTDHYFSFAKEKQILFFEFENQIWQRNFDGSDEKQVKLGEAAKFVQPSVSHDENWLYYVKRDKNSTSIWKSPIEGGNRNAVFKAEGFSPETFLGASPDGKYLAFEYVRSEKIGQFTKNSGNIRKFGFLDLETRKVRVIEVPAYNSTLRWTNGGKSFDFVSYTNAGAAIFRRNLDDDQEPAKIFEIKDEIIYRFDWSPDGKNLVVGRGNLTTNVAVLRIAGQKQNQ